jgi:hypothetical protein
VADLFDFQKPPAHPDAPSRAFVEVIKPIKPTAIIGVSTKAKHSRGSWSRRWPI